VKHFNVKTKWFVAAASNGLNKIKLGFLKKTFQRIIIKILINSFCHL